MGGGRVGADGQDPALKTPWTGRGWREK